MQDGNRTKNIATDIANIVRFHLAKVKRGRTVKNYIGVKIVKAEPMEKEGKPGYRVKYPDGYESWSPKDTFEKAYRTLDCKEFINSEE